MKPKHVYLFEFQVQMIDDITYLPYASGLLVAFAKAHTDPGNFEFHINEPIISNAPDLVAFSVSMWNLRASENFAKLLQSQYPNALFIFGGPSASEVNLPFAFRRVISDGETEFLEIITGRSQPQLHTLDDAPSPYLMGIFDELVNTHQNCQAIIETTRGCPFGCAYCFWGKDKRRLLFRSPTSIRREAEWIAQHKVKYVFCADGNFGMFPKDRFVAEVYADVKAQYGYPEKFRVCYGKNDEDTIFDTAKILSDAGLAKTVTLSRQSTNPKTLEAIGRKNVSQETFDSLQERYRCASIPTYTELILGLPEETYESFRDGIARSIERHDTQLLIYPCEVLPGTLLADPEYQERYGIKTSRALLTPVHALPLNPPEYELIVTATRTMPQEDWIKAFVLSRMVQLFYSLKVLDKLPIIPICERLIDPVNLKCSDDIKSIVYEFHESALDIIRGGGRCKMAPGFGDILWEPEEAVFLHIAQHKELFYSDLKICLPEYEDIIEQQESAFPALGHDDDPLEFAKQKILHGRKSGMKQKEMIHGYHPAQYPNQKTG